MTPKIVGLVICKNEWGLIALSVTYALLHHVDEVYVVDDSSTDQTHDGLSHLLELWRGRLHLLHLRGDEFHQEAIGNTIIHLCQNSSPDWIYVFDADEFLLIEGGASLRDVLSEMDPRYVALRYQLKSFVSVDGFDACALADYLKICHRAVPKNNLGLSELRCAEEIYNERLTYFDCPFPPKVIFRNSRWTRLRPGSHLITQYGKVQGAVKTTNRIWAAHLTWLTRESFERKAEQGKGAIEKGFPPWYSWQNQLIYKLSQEGRLGRLWERHSIPENGEPTDASPQNIVFDESFTKAIEPTLAFLESVFRSKHLSRLGENVIPSRPSDETQIPLQSVVRLVKKIFDLLDATSIRWNEVCTERDTALKEKQAALAERDIALAERDGVVH